MIYHRVLDVLRGRESPPDMFILPHVDRRALARLIRGAEVFDFGELPLEQDPRNPKCFAVPELTKEEEEFFNQGLVPVPAPWVWYDFTLKGCPSGLLVSDNFWAQRIDFPGGHRMQGYVDDVWVFRNNNGKSQVEIDSGYARECIAELGEEEFISNYGGVMPMVLYLTLMLNSKSTDRTRMEPHPDAIRAAKSRNRHALPAHTIVNIVPQYFVDAAVQEERGTHASPRLHWRRSHLRQYRAPSGEVYHRVVIPRHLVGRADLGTVTHEYRVKP